MKMRYLPAALLMLAVASVNYLPPLLGAAVVLTIPLTLVLALGAMK